MEAGEGTGKGESEKSILMASIFKVTTEGEGVQDGAWGEGFID